MATLTPVNMATAAQDALDALIKRLGVVCAATTRSTASSPTVLRLTRCPRKS
jgi:hypothetical protein